MATKCLTYDCYDRVYNSQHPLCTECYYDLKDGYLKECDDDETNIYEQHKIVKDIIQICQK